MEFTASYALATILDPRFKTLHFTSEDAKEEALVYLTTELEIMSDQVNEPEVRSTNDAKRADDGLWDYHNELCATQATESSDNSLSESQLYLKEKHIDRKQNPFLYWDMKKTTYPNLYKIAMHYLIAVATSVAAERMFSRTKLIITDLRSRLTSENANNLVFLSAAPDSLWF